MPHNLIDYLAETFKHNERWANAILNDGTAVKCNKVLEIKHDAISERLNNTDTDIISILSKTIAAELPQRLGGMKDGIIDP